MAPAWWEWRESVTRCHTPVTGVYMPCKSSKPASSDSPGMSLARPFCAASHLYIGLKTTLHRLQTRFFSHYFNNQRLQASQTTPRRSYTLPEVTFLLIAGHRVNGGCRGLI